MLCYEDAQACFCCKSAKRVDDCASFWEFYGAVHVHFFLSFLFLLIKMLQQLKVFFFQR